MTSFSFTHPIVFLCLHGICRAVGTSLKAAGVASFQETRLGGDLRAGALDEICVSLNVPGGVISASRKYERS